MILAYGLNKIKFATDEATFKRSVGLYESGKVRVIPESGKNDIRKFGDGYKAHLATPPVEGKANKALIEVIAEHFNLKQKKEAHDDRRR